MPDPTTPHTITMDGLKASWVRDSGPKATVQYECAWDDHVALITELLGGYTNTATGFGTYSPPHRHPVYTNLYAWNVQDIEGVGAKKSGGAANKWAPYTRARITVEYLIPPIAVTQLDANAANQID